jgi:UDP-3-O-[3-hydroxymyristoyl] glucosamine N-acyltransferase
VIEVGERTHFGPGAYAHETAVIGRNCVLGAHCWVGEGVVLGEGCVIQPGVKLGQDGFGYERDEDGRWVLKAHDFTVRLGDDVHIGANACIDRGSWRDTHIMRGARIDNLVHVAHNAIVGPNAVIVAGAEISGSVLVGAGAWIGPNACIRQRVTIGRAALIGMGAVVLKDVEAHTTVAGNPARVINAEEGVRDRM